MILSRLSTVAIAALLSISSPASAADSSLLQLQQGRRHLKPKTNIANQVKNDKAQGRKSKFTINAKKAGGSPGQMKKFNVKLVDNAVAPGAKVITNTGETRVVTDNEIDDILVTEPDDDKKTIGLIGVNTKNGKSHGIIVNNKPEKNVIISQNDGDDVSLMHIYDMHTLILILLSTNTITITNTSYVPSLPFSLQIVYNLLSSSSTGICI